MVNEDMDVSRNVTVIMAMDENEAFRLRDSLAEVYNYAMQANANWRTDPAVVRDLYEKLAEATR